jgi:hypothetical protein
MIELLALPGWQVPPRTLDEWVFQLSELAGPVIVTRESTGVSWVEVASLRLRGYAVLEGSRVEAINFELGAPDPGPAARAVEQAAEALGWEVHPDDPGDDPDDDDD